MPLTVAPSATVSTPSPRLPTTTGPELIQELPAPQAAIVPVEPAWSPAMTPPLSTRPAPLMKTEPIPLFPTSTGNPALTVDPAPSTCKLPLERAASPSRIWKVLAVAPASTLTEPEAVVLGAPAPSPPITNVGAYKVEPASDTTTSPKPAPLRPTISVPASAAALPWITSPPFPASPTDNVPTD
ncbi:hypothetical protein D3C71_1358810 [compost metagenome]